MIFDLVASAQVAAISLQKSFSPVEKATKKTEKCSCLLLASKALPSYSQTPNCSKLVGKIVFEENGGNLVKTVKKEGNSLSGGND